MSVRKSPLQNHPTLNRELMPGNSLPRDLDEAELPPSLAEFAKKSGHSKNLAKKSAKPAKVRAKPVKTGPASPNSKYTPARHRVIVDKSKKGLPIQKAGAISGVMGRTAARWLEEGQENPDGPYGKFALDVEKARAEYLEGIIDEWREQATTTKQWTALATLAERLYSEDFAKKEPRNQVNVVIGVLEKNLREVDADVVQVYEGG